MSLSEVAAARETEHMANAVKYNETVHEAWIATWVRNAARNYSFIEDRFKERSWDIDVMPKRLGVPVLVLASGPSLDDVVPYLRDWKGDIWCSTSQLSLLEHEGIDPTVCVYIDADPSQAFLITPKYRKGGDSKCVLLTHPSMPREIIEQWGGDIYFFRMMDPGDEFSTKYLPLMYGAVNMEQHLHVGSHVLNAGCVANSMVALSQSMGHGPIFLCGYDLGYPDGVRRFTNWIQVRHEDGGKTEWVSDRPMLPDDRPVFEGNNGVTTDELSCFYKYSFMILVGLGAPPVISCSRGILSEIPYADPEWVVKTQGVGWDHLFRTMIEGYRVCQRYLRYRGIHIVRGENRIETANETGLSYPKKLQMRFKFWKMDSFTRTVERGAPSIWKRTKMLVARGGPYVYEKDSPGYRFRSIITRRLYGEKRGGDGSKGEHGQAPGSPETPVVPEHTPEQAAAAEVS